MIRLYSFLKSYLLIRKWHKKSQLSYRTSINKNCLFEGRTMFFPNTVLIDTHVGFGTYIFSNCLFSKTKIDKYCSIGPNVKVIVGMHPTKNYISTHPLFYSDKGYCGLKFNNIHFEETDCNVKCDRYR